MLKRTRSTGELERRSSLMNDFDAHSGDRQRSCALSNEECRILNDLRQNHLLCDANISSKDQTNEFPVHRFLLAASSPFLRMAFTNLESTNYPSLQLDIRYDALEALLDYIYTRQCRLTSENVFEIIRAAQLCQMKNLFEYCCDYLGQSLNHENSFQLYQFAKTNSHSKLLEMTHRYVMYHFLQIIESNDTFLNFSIDELLEYLVHDDLNIQHEENLFDASIRWINHDLDTRQTSITTILNKLRLGLIPLPLFLNKVKQHPLIKENELCKPIIGETLRLLYKLDNEGLTDHEINSPWMRPRHAHQMILAFGGWSGGNATNLLEAYDVRADKWTIISTDQVPARAYHGCITVNNQLFVIGGFDGTEYFNSCRSFHLIHRRWTDIAPMNERRCYVSVAYLDGLLYAMGGFNGHVRQNTAEKYLFESNQWSAICPMHVQRSDASACTLNDRIYICGGFDGQECLQTAEYYNPTTNQWTMIHPMRSQRSGVGVIAYRGSVYAIGGFNGTARLNTGERYNPLMNSWRPITDMFHPRSNFAIEVLDDLIFTIGGFNGLTTIANVECYDDTTDEWYDIADMNLFRSALSACVVEGLNHTKKYLYSNNDAIKQLPIPLKTNNNNNPVHGMASPSLSVRLPPISLAGLNQSLRNFTHGRLS